jgi:hypothetical protein
MNALSKLNNFELESALKALALEERTLLHVVLEHIKEVDSRKLYLERAYPSMYEYLVKELQYSGSAAMRRLEAARLLKQIPEISTSIKNGTLNLTQIGVLSQAIKEKEKTTPQKISTLQKSELVALISGKSSHETQRDLAQALDIPVTAYDRQRTQQDESVRLELTISKELFEKLNRCRDLASHQIANQIDGASFSALFEVLADAYLKKTLLVKNTAAEQTEKANKTLTQKTKLQILERDKCCQYKDPVTGKQCGSTFLGQTDHKSSRWAGGDHAKTNLQMLCAGHNQLKYRKEALLKWL